MEVLVFLGIGGLGVLVLVIVLPVAAHKLKKRNTFEADMERIVEAEDEEYSDMFDIIEENNAIFFIG